MKLHIGCGKKYIPGYKHLDVINFDHVDFVCDTRKLTMIEDSSVSVLYACHILEHVEQCATALWTLHDGYRASLTVCKTVHRTQRKVSLIKKRCVMKSYDELKAEMETIQQQMAEAKKNDLTDTPKEVKRLCKELGFTVGMLKGALDKGRGEK